MTISPGMVLYSTLALPTGAVVAYRVKRLYREGPAGAWESHSVWMVDVMRVETNERNEVSVTEDAFYEFELKRMRLWPC